MSRARWRTPADGEVPAPFAAAVVPAETDPAARDRLRAGVARLVEEIHAGEMLQTVLARRFSVPTRSHRARHLPLAATRQPVTVPVLPRPCVVSPGAAVVGASPELLVRVRDGEVVTRPIAGTRRRDDDPAVDAALEAELRADPKELAEHAMLVDLARNDVGRVAAAGSVEVTILRDVERYAHVMHLVSEVRGRLADRLDAFDAVRSVVPRRHA